MSFDAIAHYKKNFCIICDEPIDVTEGAAIALLDCDARSGEDAQEWSDGEYKEDCDLVIGVDWEEDYPCHNQCLGTAIEDYADSLVTESAVRIREKLRRREGS